MIYLLDANVLVHWANERPGADRIFARYVMQPKDRVRLSAVTAHELRYLILAAKAGRRRAASLAALMPSFPVEDFDLPAAQAAADVRHQLGSQPIGVFDMLLAGHARRLGAIVVSDDEDFDRVPGLRRENWLR